MNNKNHNTNDVEYEDGNNAADDEDDEDHNDDVELNQTK